MTGDEVVKCAWCGETFRPRSSRGPSPRYCSASHRQRAYEARKVDSAAAATTSRANVLARGIAQPLADYQQQMLGRIVQPLADYQQQMLKGIVQPLADYQQQMLGRIAQPLADYQQQMLKGIVQPWANTVARLQNQLPPVTTWAQFAARSLNLLRQAGPPNWPDDLSWSELCELVAETGWSLTYVPRAEIVACVHHADPSERPALLLAHREEVVADCRACLDSIAEPEAAYLVQAVRQALDAFTAGLFVPAQAAVSATLGDVIGRLYGLTFAQAAHEMDEDPGEMPMPYFRFWLIMSLVPRALTRFYVHRGDQVPDTFNRHASTHTVDPRQHTELNSLVGLMLAVSLVKEIAPDLDEAPPPAP